MFFRVIFVPDLLSGIMPPLRMRLNSLELISVTRDKLSKRHKSSTFQFLMNENKSIAIKKDRLAGLAIFRDKKEKGTGKEFKVHFLDNDVGKGIMAFPHIHILGIKKN